jgi:hypothetical protein
MHQVAHGIAFPAVVIVSLVAALVLAVLGSGLAWVLRRRTMLSVRNLYLAAGAALLICVVGALVVGWSALLITAPLTAAPGTGALVGRRWRLSDLGAGEELRQHELTRRWLWEPKIKRDAGERVWLRGQGEIVHRRPWPSGVPYVPMTGKRSGPRLPRGEGQHVFICGGSGAGKTTSAQRLAAARVLADKTALLAIDAKGDQKDEGVLRRIAAAAGVPFILIDPRDPSTDRWQPLWGSPADVVARAVEPIKASEPYYYDMLRDHLGIVVEILRAADRWPVSFPLLADAVQPQRYGELLALVQALGDTHASLTRRCEEHGDWVTSPDGRKALAGGAKRLQLVMGQAWRPVLEPRITTDGAAVGVNLAKAISERAVVLWRTWADDMPDEAKAITVLALADIYAAAGTANAPWTLMLDEFGAVIQVAAERAVGVLQRGRSHHGQVIVITQSAMDIEALSQQTGLLAAMSDNFRGFCVHRQVAPESRDWLAKLMGTIALWQSTDQTAGHGSMHSGLGSRRRVREFRVGSDVFATLRDGEAVIHTTLGPAPSRAPILRVALAERNPDRIPDGPEHACEMLCHPDLALPRGGSSGTCGQQAPSNELGPLKDL